MALKTFLDSGVLLTAWRGQPSPGTAAACEPFSPELGKAARGLARRYGVSAGDALNLTAAVRQGVEQFVTSELPGKAIFRVAEISVISIHAAGC